MAIDTSGERGTKARSIHIELDRAADAINAAHAQVLARIIEANAWKIHRDIDGFSSLREWLLARFAFTADTASDLAVIAKCARKFSLLAETASSGASRIDVVASAVRRLENVKALRVYAKTPYREPEPSPFDTDTLCATPEALSARTR